MHYFSPCKESAFFGPRFPNLRRVVDMNLNKNDYKPSFPGPYVVGTDKHVRLPRSTTSPIPESVPLGYDMGGGCLSHQRQSGRVNIWCWNQSSQPIRLSKSFSTKSGKMEKKSRSTESPTCSFLNGKKCSNWQTAISIANSALGNFSQKNTIQRSIYFYYCCFSLLFCIIFYNFFRSKLITNSLRTFHLHFYDSRKPNFYKNQVFFNLVSSSCVYA